MAAELRHIWSSLDYDLLLNRIFLRTITNGNNPQAFNGASQGGHVPAVEMILV